MNTGYIKLHRSLRNWQWYQKPIIKSVFIHLLLTANHADAYWQGIVIKAGQCVTSYESLAKSLGISVKQARTAIKSLKKSREISVEVTNKYSLITIENWALYQSTDHIGAGKGQAEGRQRATNKKEEKEKNNQAYSPSFLSFCSAYPKSVDKPAASRCWHALVADGHTDKELVKAAQNYARACKGREPRYIKNASTFLGSSKPFLEFLGNGKKLVKGESEWLN